MPTGQEIREGRQCVWWIGETIRSIGYLGLGLGCLLPLPLFFQLVIYHPALGFWCFLTAMTSIYWYLVTSVAEVIITLGKRMTDAASTDYLIFRQAAYVPSGNAERICPICLDHLGTEGHFPVALGCGHVYGFRCIGEWLKGQKSTCPCCRTAPYRIKSGRRNTQ